MTITETDVCEQIRDAMREYPCEYGAMMYTTGFKSAGVMTDDTGFVIKMRDGSEFYVTVKSRAGGNIMAQVTEDTLEPIGIELQRIEEKFTELIQRMDSDEDINDLTEALNHVQAVRHRFYMTWFVYGAWF